MLSTPGGVEFPDPGIRPGQSISHSRAVTFPGHGKVEQWGSMVINTNSNMNNNKRIKLQIQ